MSVLDPANYQVDIGNYYYWAAVVNAVVALVSAVYVLSRNRRHTQNVGFFLFAFALFFWSATYAIWQSSVNAETALFWSRTLMVGAIPLAPALLYFFLTVVGSSRTSRAVLWSSSLATLFFLVVSYSPLFVSRVEPTAGFPFWPKPGPLYLPYLIVWSGTLLYAFWLMYRSWSRADHGPKRRQRLLLLVGFTTAVVSGSFNYFLWYDIPIKPYPTILTSGYVILIAYAMSRYGLFPVDLRTAARTILQAIPDALFVVERSQIVQTNATALKLLGRSSEEVVGRNLEDYLPGFSGLSASLSSGSTESSGTSMDLTARNGSVVRVSISVRRIPSTEGGLVVVCHDVRPISEAFERLEEARDVARRQHERLRTVLDSLNSGIVVIGLDGRIELLNGAAARMIGLSGSRTVVGQPFSSVFAIRDSEDGSDAGAFVWQSISESHKSAARASAVLRVDGGQDLPVQVVSFPVISDGTVIGAVAVIEDDREGRAIGERKDELVSVTAHQLKAPISAARWYVESLLNGDAGALTPSQTEMLTDLLRVNESMRSLINALLNISRLERGMMSIRPEPVSLQELCRAQIEQVRPLAKAKGVTIKADLQWSGEIPVDPDLTREAIKNLMENAVKYTPRGGEVTVGLTAEGEEAVISVADNGIGIPQQDQPKVFAKFFRAANAAKSDQEGSGLGLSLTQKVVRASGGRIWFKSQEGRGTTFYIALPLTGSQPVVGSRTLAL